MKTKQLLNVRAIVFLAILLIANTAAGWSAKPESVKKKEISKSFDVSLSDLLMTDNRYGNTTITHWNKKEVSIRVEIEAKANSAETAQAIIDRIQIELKKTGNTVSAVTSLKSQNKSWSNGDNQRFTINYFISMPSKLAINLSQKYGNINLPEKNEGKSTIEVKYGNLNAGSFTQTLNLEVKYGNVDINDVTKANIDLGYCGNTLIGNADQLNIDSKYSGMEVRSCKQINLENKYGNVRIKNLDKGHMEIKYSEVTIDNVTMELKVEELAYSTLNIKELSADFNNINIDARYGNLNINVPTNASFKISAENLKYGNHSVKGLNVTNSSTENKVNHYYQINGGGKGHIYFDGNSYSNINVRGL